MFETGQLADGVEGFYAHDTCKTSAAERAAARLGPQNACALDAEPAVSALDQDGRASLGPSKHTMHVTKRRTSALLLLCLPLNRSQSCHALGGVRST